MTALISRQNAMALGLKRYFTGKPCKRGHVSEMQTASRKCLDCERQRNNANYRANRCAMRKYRRALYHANPDKKSSSTKYYYANRDACLEGFRKYYQENRDACLERGRKSYQKNREKWLEYGVAHYKDISTIHQLLLNKGIIQKSDPPNFRWRMVTAAKRRGHINKGDLK
jgi:hypothetical protein